VEAKKDMVISYLTPKSSMNIYPFKAFKISNRSFSQYPHAHSYLQIWYVKNGGCIHCLNNVEHKLQKGDIFILPPDVPHRVICEDEKNIELLGCEFMEEFICGSDGETNSVYYQYINPFIVPEKEVKPFYSLEGVTVREVEKLFDDMVKEYNTKPPHFELSMRANFLKLLAILVRVCAKETGEKEKNGYYKHRNAIATALSYMNEHYSEKIYLEDLCKLLLMSPTYFSCVFKQITGKTFTEQLNSIRVGKAKEMLMDHSKTVSRIAIEVGFTDSAYFDRVFKKEVGVSPGKFRKYL